MGASSSSDARPADEGASDRGAAARPTPVEAIQGARAHDDAAHAVAPVLGVWADALGRAGSRAAQTLLIAAVVVGVVWVLLRVTLVVIALLVALILAAAVAPAVKWLERRGWSDLLATLAAFLGILVLVGGVLTGIVFSVRSEWDTLTTQAVEGWEELQRFVTAGPVPIDTAAIDEAARQVGQFLSSGAAASGAISGISAATQVITGAVLVIVILFFFLKDGETMWNFLLRWTRGERRAKLAESIDRGSEVLGGYVRGTAAIALADGILIGAFLVIFRVPLALPLAVIAFVTAFIPVIGATIAGALAALVALVTNGPLIALALIAWVIIVNQIEGNILQPIIMGRTLSLHPLLILLALTVGTIVGGIFGAILAVPYTAVTWAILQVWATGYQAGPDPVLGADPLDPKDQMRDKATLAQRFRYQRMRLQHRRGARLGATEQDTTGTNPTDKTDTEHP
ncbi:MULTISPECIES: AI-2E family transporter [Micrococcaceae]|uniref:AI-2E family transporter n=1 Tax=Micrococcaceae TaxID=1268 RepID=UPI00161DD01C|nr:MULTISPECIES: AI-2E family transporter [Micrococcaceae]MBB5750063.1 putative PurR-regulated permease PerM [Micrococcus sp. TA1]HRO94821.1 AI-2E family transporter [Citricoccus sp.]